MKKRSFFDRFTGTDNNFDSYEDLFEDERPTAGEEIPEEVENDNKPAKSTGDKHTSWIEQEAREGDLSVDVYQTDDAIVVKALIAGVLPGNVDISVTRDMLTIEGRREEEREVEEGGYFYKELYWGSFSRSILLPEEVDVDMAEATEKHGVLMIRLPKINKARSTKLKVKSR